MTQLEVYKSFQFMAELLLAESLFVFRLRRRSLPWLRIPVGIGLCFLFSWLFPVLSTDAFYCSFMFLAIFAFTILICKGVFKETWLTVVFLCIAGYTTQHMTYELYSLALNLMGANADTPMGFYGSEFAGTFSNPFLAVVYFYIYIVTYFLSFFFFGRKIKERDSVQLKSSFIFMFAILIVAVDIILNALVVFNIASDGNSLYLIIVGIYNILCCIIALYLQFEVSLRRKLETTLDTVQQIWHQVKEQYAISKENIALINMKCHDLKYQIRSLEGGEAISSTALKDIADRISIYDSAVKTGNDALDVILTEKSLHCNKNGVKLSCIVDGEKLDFMAEEDIYVLFGNIIDNAIEAVLKLDASKRVISLHVKAIDGLLTIRVYNYYGDSISFQNGLPQTTKEDKRYHGFGIRSIQYICEKYDGDLSIKTENNVFTINILFFLKQA